MKNIKRIIKYIVILVVIFILSYYIGKEFGNEKNTEISIATENIKDSIKYKLDLGWHKYTDWEKKEIYEISIECDKKDLFIAKATFEDYGDIYFEFLKKDDFYMIGGFGDEEYWQNYCEK